MLSKFGTTLLIFCEFSWVLGLFFSLQIPCDDYDFKEMINLIVPLEVVVFEIISLWSNVYSSQYSIFRRYICLATFCIRSLCPRVMNITWEPKGKRWEFWQLPTSSHELLAMPEVILPLSLKGLWNKVTFYINLSRY